MTATAVDSPDTDEDANSSSEPSQALDSSALRKAESTNDAAATVASGEKQEAPKSEPSLFSRSDSKKSFLDKNKNKLLIGGGIGSSAIILISFAFFMFAFLGPLKTVHFATILRSVGFARFNLYTRRVYARTTFDAAVLSPDSTGNFKLGDRSLVEKLKRVNPDKQLRVLGKDGSLKFKFEGTSTFGGIKKTNDFKGVVIDGKEVTLDDVAKQFFPNKGPYDKLTRAQKWTVESKFVGQVQGDLSKRLSVENRAFRSSVYNGLRQAAGISMVKWVNKAKEFAGKSPTESKKLNIKETLRKISGLGNKSGISELNNDAEKYKANVAAAAEAGLPTADVKPITKLNGKIAEASLPVFIITAACIVHDLSKSVKEATLQRERGALQMGHDVLTTADQIKQGDTAAEAVGAESSRWDGAENSVLYKKAVGQPVTAEDNKQLTTIPTTTPDSTFGKSITAVNAVFDTIQFGGIPGLGSALKSIPGVGTLVTGAQDAECSVVLNQYVQYGIATGEIVVAVASIGFEEGIAQGIKTAIQGALKFTGTIGLGELLGSLIDTAVKNIAGTDYSGIQNGPELYSQSAVGVEALAQPGNRQITYGRSLNSQEVTGSQQMAMAQEKAFNKNLSFKDRYVATDNATSLLSRLAAVIPTSFSTLFSGFRDSLVRLGTFITTPAKFLGKIASFATALHPSFAAQATSINGRDFGIDEQGWSTAELDRIDSDPAFSGKALANFVEPQYDELNKKYSPCFSYVLQSQKPDNCDGLLSPSASNYEESLMWRAYMAESYAADSLSLNLGVDPTQ